MAASPPEYAVRAPEEATTRWQGRTTHKGFPERHRIDWVDDVQLEAASSKHGPTAATALGL